MPHDTVDVTTAVEVVQVAVPEVVVEEVLAPSSLIDTQIEIVVEPQPQIEVLEVERPEIITETVEAVTVLTEGIQGPPGPPGPPGVSEEDVVYTKRLDVVSDLLMYRGEAAVGSVETNPVWRIRRITIAVDGDITEEWASGTADFIHPWTDRLALSYS
jgi:hypothetical protein